MDKKIDREKVKLATQIIDCEIVALKSMIQSAEHELQLTSNPKRRLGKKEFLRSEILKHNSKLRDLQASTPEEFANSYLTSIRDQAKIDIDKSSRYLLLLQIEDEEMEDVEWASKEDKNFRESFTVRNLLSDDNFINYGIRSVVSKELWVELYSKFREKTKNIFYSQKVQSKIEQKVKAIVNDIDLARPYAEKWKDEYRVKCKNRILAGQKVLNGSDIELLRAKLKESEELADACFDELLNI